MQNVNRAEPHPMIAPLLDPEERPRAQVQAVDAHVTVTDRRLVVVANERVAINIGFERLRRVQFDLERTRPATLVIVPELPADPPQVLGIPFEEVPNVASVLTVLGERLSQATDTSGIARDSRLSAD